MICSTAALALAAQYCVFGATPSPTVTDRQAARLLDQAAWGPTPAEIAQVQSQGLSNWIDSQFSATPSDLPDQPILNLMGKGNNDLNPVRAALFQNAVSHPDQLLQRVTFALSQLWVVSQQSGVNPAYAYPPYWRVLRDNAFKNYADIIKNVTLNPAMGRYLNMANNNKGNAARGTSANENYGRELMQLFTLGLTQLGTDGSYVLDVSGRPLPTFTEPEVRDLAKALTGWTYPTAPGAIEKANNPEYYFGPMRPVAANHDTSKKTVFGGYPILPNQTPEQDLDSVVQGLMQQPTIAPFVCRQLIEHLVTSNPTPAYLQRVSGVFLNNGSGVRGDMKAVIKAILLDSEARSGDEPTAPAMATFGHLREPVLLMANLLRGLNGAVPSTNGIGNFTSQLAENIFDEPSVFSYFSPNSRTERGLYGPEFQIYSTQTSTTRANLIYSALYSGSFGGTTLNLAPFTAKITKVSDPSAMIDYINYVFLHRSASPDLIRNATNAAKAAASPANATKSALFVMLTSAEYQVIH